MDLQHGQYSRLTSTNLVTSKPGALLGFYVSSTNVGTLVLRDGGASGTVISGTITPAIGWHFYSCGFGTNLHATIGGTALDVTFVFLPTAGQ